MFVAVDRSLRSIEAGQMRKIRALTENAYRTADTISSALGNIGLSVNVNFGGNADGGPLIATVPGQFDAESDRLDEALGTLDAIKANTRLLPIANPLPGSTVTSPYGKRRDPILHRPAMHSGMDFRALSGAPVKAAGARTVVAAGWNDGYGRMMIDIDHGNGTVTRYAHMKKITVRKGQKVRAGVIVGKVGSSGRPTGSHLHYEVRRRSRPVNPNRFLAVVRKLAKAL